jgi:hypothetical protein
MADFRDQKKFETRESFIQVDAGLPVGRYLFLLTVVDDQGNSSQPAKLNVEIIDGSILRDPRLVDPVIREPISPISPVIRP